MINRDISIDIVKNLPVNKLVKIGKTNVLRTKGRVYENHGRIYVDGYDLFSVGCSVFPVKQETLKKIQGAIDNTVRPDFTTKGGVQIWMDNRFIIQKFASGNMVIEAQTRPHLPSVAQVGCLVIRGKFDPKDRQSYWDEIDVAMKTSKDEEFRKFIKSVSHVKENEIGHLEPITDGLIVHRD